MSARLSYSETIKWRLLKSWYSSALKVCLVNLVLVHIGSIRRRILNMKLKQNFYNFS